MENKLPEPFKSEWIAALRSGKYIQTRSVLYNYEESKDDKLAMCCLGVAEHICGTPLENLRHTTIPSNLRIDGKRGGKSPALLQETWDDTFNNIVSKLAQMNDGIDIGCEGSKSFEEIANWIEENL